MMNQTSQAVSDDCRQRHYRGTLSITLKSDLCTGSGMSYAGIIDSDVCHNEYGIPEIPGKRLKGCMRESAEKLGLGSEKDRKAIFGVAGQKDVRGIIIGNAYFTNSRELAEFLEVLKERKTAGDPETSYLTKDNLLDLYTSVRAQTKIVDETGVADDTSLRFTRVINKYDFITGNEMVFVSKIEFTGTEEQWILLKKIAVATRNIGLNRNRGLGSVHMEMEGHIVPADKINDNYEGSGLDRSVPWQLITYRIKNTEPLMISGNTESSSRNQINGASILGVLASEYLKTGRAEDREFIDLFLRGDACFSDLTITELLKGKEEDQKDAAQKWLAYEPAPLYMARLKKTKKLVNLASELQWMQAGSLSEAYNPGDGNQPKKLNRHFIAWKEDGSCSVTEVKRLLTYHHSHSGKTIEGETGLLYSSEAVAPGQFFAGDILVKTEYAELVYRLLSKATLRFGKSKTAQYGSCKLADNPVISPLERKTGEISPECIPGGSRILITFLSNAVFTSDVDGAEGSYTVDEADIRNTIIKEFAEEGIELELADSSDQAWMQACEITGYNSTWNMKKQAFPALCAGSALSFRLKNDLKKYPMYVGEKNLEGFGRIRVACLSDMIYAVKEWKTVSDNNEAYRKLKNLTIVRSAFQKILCRQMGEELRAKAFMDQRIGITASALGRLTLMLIEACNENPADAWKQYMSLRKRILSIKSDTSRNNILMFLQKILGEDELGKVKRQPKEESGEYLDRAEKEKKEAQMQAVIQKMTETPSGELLRNEFPEEANDLILAAALEYLKDVLAYQKYLGKEA